MLMKAAWRAFIVALLIVFITGCGSTNKTPDKNTTPDSKASPNGNKLSELMTYKGSDREQKLIAGAKSEGELVLYTQISQEDANTILQKFSEKYGLTTKLYRAQGEDVLQKTLTEAQAGRVGADVFELDSPFLDILGKEGQLAKFWSQYLQDYPEQTKDPNGFWQGTRLTFDVLAYNTSLIKPEQVPRSYEDLLKPEYAGKLGMEAVNADWFATLVKFWGEEKGKDYFKKLGDQKLQIRSGHTLLTDLVVAGEFPVTINSYNHKIEQYKKKGAPIEWVPLEPVVAIPSGVGVAGKAPHPNAAILFAEFMLSNEGQEMLRDLKRVPGNTKIEVSPPNLNKGFNYIPLDTSAVSEYEKWQGLFDELIVLKGQKK